MFRGFGGPKSPPKKRKQERRDLPFQRVTAEIQVDATQEVAESRVFLNDLTPQGVGCFTNVSFDKGEKVSMVIEQPKHLFVKGEIIWCSPYTLETKIISAEQFKFRAGIKFLFDTPDEANAIKKYVEELYTS